MKNINKHALRDEGRLAIDLKNFLFIYRACRKDRPKKFMEKTPKNC